MSVIMKLRSLVRTNKFLFVCLAGISILMTNYIMIMQKYELDRGFIELDEGDDDTELSFRDRYLTTLKDPKTNMLSLADSSNSYDKLKVMDFLDNLMEEPIDEFSLQITQDPYEMILQQDVDFVSMKPADKAAFYARIVEQSKWKFRPVQEMVYRDIYDHQRYLDLRVAKWEKIRDMMSDEDIKSLGLDSKNIEEAILNNKKLKIEHNKKSIHEIQNSFRHLRLFNNIFLENDKNDQLDTECANLMNTHFPYLSNNLPRATKWKNKQSSSVDLYPIQKECIVKTIRANLKGRGIVISATDRLMNELAGLIALLRVLGNEYPIQIFHSNDLSAQTQRHLSKIATDSVVNLPKSYNTVKSQLNTKFPKQDITFVDVSRVVDFRFKDYFRYWSNKLLAYQFNTFEEMVMLDTDTVPLLPIEDYFNMPNYKASGTSFFRDREANNFIFPEVIDMFKEFLTTAKDQEVLQLPLPSEQLLQNRFFHDRARHFMEAGLFCINKRQHFGGMLGSLQLNFFLFVSGTVHGEKELIWMGPQFMGDNNYRFNKNPAVAVGELTSEEFVESKKSKELCSTHPGHLSDEDSKTIIWFNSGFSTCKKPEAYFKDIHYERNSKMTLRELKYHYVSPLKIRAVLRPPPGEYEVPNKVDHYEPSRGWIMTTQCENYMWCAYDVLGGDVMASEVPHGVIHEYTDAQTALWTFYGEVWVDHFNSGSTIDETFFMEDEEGYDDLLSDTSSPVSNVKNPEYDPKPVDPHTKGSKGSKGSKGRLASEDMFKGDGDNLDEPNDEKLDDVPVKGSKADTVDAPLKGSKADDPSEGKADLEIEDEIDKSPSVNAEVKQADDSIIGAEDLSEAELAEIAKVDLKLPKDKQSKAEDAKPLKDTKAEVENTKPVKDTKANAKGTKDVKDAKAKDAETEASKDPKEKSKVEEISDYSDGKSQKEVTEDLVKEVLGSV